MLGYVKGHNQVGILCKVPNFQVEADNKHVPRDPEDHPDGIPDYISLPELDSPKKAKDDSDNVQKVSQDRCPLIAKKIKDLSLQHKY